jgi:hypothetical protein
MDAETKYIAPNTKVLKALSGLRATSAKGVVVLLAPCVLVVT